MCSDANFAVERNKYKIMVTMNAVEFQSVLVRNLVGNSRLMAPVDGIMTEVDADDYEALVRYLAYGLMVKGFRRGNNIYVTSENQDMFTFVDAACRLAHLNAVKTDLSRGDQSSLMDDDVDYLMMLGRTWSYKYKALVDRSVREICG